MNKYLNYDGLSSFLEKLFGIFAELVHTHKTADVTGLDDALNSKAKASDLGDHTSNKSNPHNVTLNQLGITASADELNKMDGIIATTTELNYIDGVTGNIQTQLDDKAAKDTVEALEDLVGSIAVSDQIATAIENNVKQGDWNQSDSTKPDYVKNRTHYATNIAVNELYRGNIDFYGQADGYYWGMIEPSAPIELGQEYALYIDGVLTKGFAYSFAGVVCIGNPHMISPEIPTNGYSALAVYDGSMLTIISGDGSATEGATAQFYSRLEHRGAYYVKLHEGYLPTYIGTQGTGLNAESFNCIGNHDNPANTASGESSHAEGLGTTASAEFTHSEGHLTTASGAAAHAEGNGTTASGNGAHAEGEASNASNSSAHAEGNGTSASGIAAHSEGNGTAANGRYSHSEGDNTVADSETQHVQGKYNVRDAQRVYAHIVGNGTSDTARSNAHTIDWYGNGWFAGDIKVGGSGYSDEAAVSLAKTSDLDDYLPLAGGTLTGEVIPSGYDTLNLGSPSARFANVYGKLFTGNANTATTLATQRTFITDLTKNDQAMSFNGASNCTPGVTGILKAENGGTGVSSLEDLKSALGIKNISHGSSLPETGSAGDIFFLI